MNKKIIQQFERIRKENRIGLMTHIVCGYPTLKKSEDIVESMQKSGVDFIELQIPFSDPMADGPVIMQANEYSLKNGVRIKDCLALMKKLSQKVSIPLLFMSYFNPIFQYGVERFAQKSSECGATGCIVPDLPIDESSSFVSACRKFSIDPIFVIAPTTLDKRLKLISKSASGFVYLMARAGITGSETHFSSDLAHSIKKIRRHISLPLACGFGIHSSSQIQFLHHQKVDIAVIGSAIIKLIQGHPDKDPSPIIQSFLSQIVA